ncbi:MAG: hypothetical protein R6V05_04775 [Candidatus Brocadiia bacterium]
MHDDPIHRLISRLDGMSPQTRAAAPSFAPDEDREWVEHVLERRRSEPSENEIPAWEPERAAEGVESAQESADREHFQHFAQEAEACSP